MKDTPDSDTGVDTDTPQAGSGPKIRRRRIVTATDSTPDKPEQADKSEQASKVDKPSKVDESKAEATARSRNGADTKSADSDGAEAPKKRTRKLSGSSSTTTSAPAASVETDAATERASREGEAKSGRDRRPRAKSADGKQQSDTSGREDSQRGKTEAQGGKAKKSRAARSEGAAKTAEAASHDAAAAAAARLPVPPKVVQEGGKPRIGDSRPAPAADAAGDKSPEEGGGGRRRRRGGRGRGRGKSGDEGQQNPQNRGGGGGRNGQQGKGKQRNKPAPVEATLVDDAPVELDEKALKRRRGRERKGKPAGRYQMAVHVHGDVTHIAVLEGRALIEHYVSRPADDVSQIHGNIYVGRVQNVLPGMEAAFVDIGTPKNAVLYRGDVTFDRDDIDSSNGKPAPAKGRKGRRRPKDGPRIEELLKARQTIICQVTKNPIGHKGARLTTEISLPGRFVVMVPNSTTYGISKRLPDKERKRLRSILDKVKPEGHGLIVRTAAESVTAEEIERDVARLHQQWLEIEKLAKSTKAPSLLFREPDMAVRVIREEFSRDYRGVVIDDRALFEQVKGYMETVTPALADRIEFHDPTVEPLPLFEKYHVAEQFRKAIDRKVWLPSGGSLIIEHTEALTVIDVNTGKNVGSSNLEETVFSNNLEAAEEIAKQLRLRDIGGIIVIDFIDMEVKKNRDEVIRVFRDALARDKTRTQAFDITDLGLVEMTRKRIGEGLLESVSAGCEVCEGRGMTFDRSAMPS